MRFDWNKVSERLLRSILQSAYKDSPDQLASLKTLNHAQLAEQATRVFGTPPSRSRLDNCDGSWDVLREVWLSKDANPEQLAGLADMVRRGLAVADRESGAQSRAQLLAFFGRRNLTNNFKVNLRSAFIKAHKSEQPVRSSGGHSVAGALEGVTRLRGEGAHDLPVPYTHQLLARDQLRKLALGAKSTDRRGLLVLPTGAGKTSTVIGWLVPWLAEDPTRRVLWLAHQQELLIQARDAFEHAAQEQEVGFDRQLRLITSGGSSASTLIDPALDVVLATWQTINAQGAQQQISRLTSFLSRPTVVIVDEAHHAAAAAYQRILGTVLKAKQVVLVGMTATPWPTTDGAGSRLRRTFPVDIYTVTAERMYEAGILATPMLHTVNTGTRLELTDQEKRLASGDLPPAVLRRLATGARNDLLVRTWLAKRNVWDKTLVFAANIAHANTLGDLFRDRDTPVRVLHSDIVEPRHEVIDWFKKQKQPSVLVSVGMLTEGVDLPDARTAFLARPTTSRILMRQMIGRVLRGVHSGGSATANLVYFRDQWVNFDEVVEPGELPGLDTALVEVPEAGAAAHRLPPILDEFGIESIGADVLAQIRRMYTERNRALPIDPASTGIRLVGYYQLDDANVPVMEHQRDDYDELIHRTLRGDSFQGTPPLRVFQDDPPPYPTARQVNMVIDYIRTFEASPPFHEIRASVSPRDIAQELRELPAKTDRHKEQWLVDRYESSLARLVYATFEHFEESVERELRELRQAERSGTTPSNPEHLAPRPSGRTRDPLTRRPKRTLPRERSLLDAIRKTLAEESVFSRLDINDIPKTDWTDHPIEGAWAYWSLPAKGKSKGQPIIRINRALQASEKQVSDDVLMYLLYHEMLHHLLPGQGHDAEFRRLEALWPHADELDMQLDTLHETFEFKATRR